ncbi:MAG: glycosyltransferase, partial [Alphaproteobacteria bacterium]|nr:glycosyltransferase [Alphaproteobacteria bacterium]
MKILFATGHLYLPQMRGGLQHSTHQLCRSLQARGHGVSVLCALAPGGWVGTKSRAEMRVREIFSGCKVARDTAPGYPVWRTWFPWDAVAYVAQKEKPDLIVVLAMKPVRMALAARETGVPILMQLLDVEFGQHGGDFATLGDVPCVANSNFTAQAYRDAFGVDPAVIHPFIDLDKYRTETTRENVTFINPVAPKGRDIAIEVARLCPD